MTAIKVLTLLGDGFMKLLQAKQGHSEKDAREAIKLLKTSNPDLFHWLARITDEDSADVRETLANYESLIKSWVEAAAPFQNEGDLSELLVLGDSTVLQGLKLGIAALRREKIAQRAAEALLNHPAPKQVADSKGKVYTYSREPVGWEFDAQAPAKSIDDLWKHPRGTGRGFVYTPAKSQLDFMENKAERMIAGGSATARPDATPTMTRDELIKSCNKAGDTIESTIDRDMFLLSQPVAKGYPPLKDGMLGRIANYAQAMHAGQTGKYGDINEPYIHHVERVVKRCEGNDSAKAVAWLHDVVEDCRVSLADLPRYPYDVPSHIVDAVGLLTRPRSNHNYFEYIQAIRDSKNELAIAVKLADLQDHLARVGIPEFKRVQYSAAIGLLKPGVKYCANCGHIWGAYEDNCQCPNHKPENGWLW